MLKFIQKIHHSLPPEVRGIYRLLIVFFRKIKKFVLPVLTFECFISAEEGHSFTFMHIGWDDKLRAYWLDRLGINYKHIKSNKVLSFYISQLLNKSRSKVDLVLVESDKNAKPNAYKNGFMIPRWMEMIVHIESSLKKSKIKNIIRSIKKYSLAYEIKNSREDFDLFYHHMYKPFSLKRHGKSADIADYKHFANKYRKDKSELFFIVKDNETIASAYIEYIKDIPRVSAIGVKDADDNYFRMGVVGALYYFVMSFYLSKGISEIFVGNTMPVLFDGVTEFKMQMGAKPFLNDLKKKQKTFLFPLSANQNMIQSLQANPFFYLNNNHLNICTFNAASFFNTKEEFLVYFKRIRWKHATKLAFYYYNEKFVFDEWLGNAEIPNIEFRSLKSLIE